MHLLLECSLCVCVRLTPPQQLTDLRLAGHHSAAKKQQEERTHRSCQRKRMAYKRAQRTARQVTRSGRQTNSLGRICVGFPSRLRTVHARQGASRTVRARLPLRSRSRLRSLLRGSNGSGVPKCFGFPLPAGVSVCDVLTPFVTYSRDTWCAACRARCSTLDATTSSFCSRSVSCARSGSTHDSGEKQKRGRSSGRTQSRGSRQRRSRERRIEGTLRHSQRARHLFVGDVLLHVLDLRLEVG